MLVGIRQCYRSCVGAKDTSSGDSKPASKTVSPPPPQPPQFKVVANTHGEGVFLRKSVAQADRSRAVREGTTLEVTGATDTQNGTDWTEVRLPDGIAWAPSKFLVDSPPTLDASSGEGN